MHVRHALCFSALLAEAERPNIFHVFIFVSVNLLFLNSFLLCFDFFSGSTDGNSLTTKQAFIFCSEGVLAQHTVLHPQDCQP